MISLYNKDEQEFWLLWQMAIDVTIALCSHQIFTAILRFQWKDVIISCVQSPLTAFHHKWPGLQSQVDRYTVCPIDQVDQLFYPTFSDQLDILCE